MHRRRTSRDCVAILAPGCDVALGELLVSSVRDERVVGHPDGWLLTGDACIVDERSNDFVLGHFPDEKCLCISAVRLADGEEEGTTFKRLG